MVANMTTNVATEYGTNRDAGTYGARGAIAPLPFLAGGKGGKGALFQKYNINEI